MNTAPAPETYTVTKYDSAKQDGYRRSNPVHYWFDVQDNKDNTWLIMGATHAETAPNSAHAAIDEIEFTRVPVETAKMMQLGSIVLRAAAKDFHTNGATQLSIEEPMISDARQWENAFGKQNLAYNPPVDTSSDDPELFLDTTLSVDLTRLDMAEWPTAHVYTDSPQEKPAGYTVVPPEALR